ncbi:MAG: hypothetical protein IT385_15825 [Deltaproteobacteria bacterium]|nr:hypothetical protein [Deltaproteobacteria bacterium]
MSAEARGAAPSGAVEGRDVVVRVRESEHDALAATLASRGFRAVDKPEPGAAPAGLVVDPAALGSDALGRINRAAMAYPYAPLIVVTGPLERPVLADIIEKTSLVSLIGRDTPEHAHELDLALEAVTAGPNGPTPGAGSLLTGAPSARYAGEIASSDERDALIDRLEAFLAEAGIRARMVRIAVDAIEELVTNALYDAPVDEDGRRLNAELDRRIGVHLAPPDRPRFEVLVRGPVVAASMIDPHGSLDLATVRRFLAQGLRGDVSDKPGGAGLGFARVYGLVDRLAVRVVSRVRTETAFVIDTSTPRKDPAARPTSFLGWQG